MSRQVHCIKLQTESEGLDFAPFPGPLGERIFNEVSKQAWQDWLGKQTILINEYRLSALDPKAQQFLREEMQKYLFDGEEAAMPEAFNPTP